MLAEFGMEDRKR